jgi:hypothetical protein
MKKSVFVIAVIAAACSSVALAGEVKKDKAQVPAVKATTMSDADMDKVTGAGIVINQGHPEGNLNSNVNFHAVVNGFNGQGHNAARACIIC